MNDKKDGKILIIDDSEELREILAIILESNFNYEILEASTIKYGKEQIEGHDPISIIFCDYNLDDGKGYEIFNFVKEKYNHIPFILMSGVDIEDIPAFANFKEINHRNNTMPKPFSMNTVVETIQKTLNPQELEKSIEYFKINGKRLLKFSHMKSDLYLKISDENYVKISSKDEVMDVDQISKYLEKGNTFFYIPKLEYPKFIDESLENLAGQMENPSLSIEEGLSLQIFTVAQIHECLHNIGIKEETLKQAEKTVTASIEFIKKNNSLKEKMTDFLKHENYIFGHTILTSYLINAISENLQWTSPATNKKLMLACLVHDLPLKDEHLAKITTTDCLKYKQLGREEQKLVLNHPKSSSKLLAMLPNIDKDTFDATEQHHEMPDGSGFPNGIRFPQISPISALFIVSHHFADQIMERGYAPSTIKEIIRNFKFKFKDGSFAKIYEALLAAVNQPE